MGKWLAGVTQPLLLKTSSVLAQTFAWKGSCTKMFPSILQVGHVCRNSAWFNLDLIVTLLHTCWGNQCAKTSTSFLFQLYINVVSKKWGNEVMIFWLWLILHHPHFVPASSVWLYDAFVHVGVQVCVHRKHSWTADSRKDQAAITESK